MGNSVLNLAKQLRTGPQKAVGALALLLAVLLVAAVLIGGFLGERKLEGMKECSGDDTSGCLVAKKGSLDSKPGKKRPELSFKAEGSDDADRFKGTLTKGDLRDMNRVDDDEVGYYLDDDLVGIKDADGDTHWDTSSQRWSWPLLVVVPLLFLGLLGCLLWLFRSIRGNSS